MEWKLEVVRFNSEDVIATSAPASEPFVWPEGFPTYYPDFQKLSNAEKFQLMNEFGEDEYNSLVMRLQQEYKAGGIEFGD